MDGLDKDLLGDAAAEGDRRVGPAAADKQGASENGLAVKLDDIVLVKAEGHQSAPDALAAGEIDDPERGIMRGVEEGHEGLS
jgi:hypothetical protein